MLTIAGVVCLLLAVAVSRVKSRAVQVSLGIIGMVALGAAAVGIALFYGLDDYLVSRHYILTRVTDNLISPYALAGYSFVALTIGVGILLGIAPRQVYRLYCDHAKKSTA